MQTCIYSLVHSVIFVLHFADWQANFWPCPPSSVCSLSHFCVALCRLVGRFLALSPEFCFVVEDQQGVCGYALSARDAKSFMTKTRESWTPAMCEKYPKPLQDDISPAEVKLHYHCVKGVFLPEFLSEVIYFDLSEFYVIFFFFFCQELGLFLLSSTV